MTTHKRKTIALDLGDVAIHWRSAHFFNGISKLFEVPSEDVRMFWQSGNYQDPDSLRARADCGLSSREIHKKFVERFKQVAFDEFIHTFNASCNMRIIEGFLAFRDELARADVELIVLSNISVIHRDHVLQKFPEIFDPHISHDRQFFSCDIGSIKHPDPRHFHAIAKKIRRNIEDMLLIDDRTDNIEGIIAAGGDGIVHEGDFEKTKKELRKRKII